MVDKKKLLSCVFDDDVLCSYLKFHGVMERCFDCPHYKRFNREMLEADMRMMDEIDEERRTGVCE